MNTNAISPFYQAQPLLFGNASALLAKQSFEASSVPSVAADKDDSPPGSTSPFSPLAALGRLCRRSVPGATATAATAPSGCDWTSDEEAILLSLCQSYQGLTKTQPEKKSLVLEIAHHTGKGECASRSKLDHTIRRYSKAKYQLENGGNEDTAKASMPYFLEYHAIWQGIFAADPKGSARIGHLTSSSSSLTSTSHESDCEEPPDIPETSLRPVSPCPVSSTSSCPESPCPEPTTSPRLVSPCPESTTSSCLVSPCRESANSTTTVESSSAAHATRSCSAAMECESTSECADQGSSEEPKCPALEATLLFASTAAAGACCSASRRSSQTSTDVPNKEYQDQASASASKSGTKRPFEDTEMEETIPYCMGQLVAAKDIFTMAADYQAKAVDNIAKCYKVDFTQRRRQ
ncbi:MAG: hypothetical protein J3Q66DRAFT_326089 [Benniella sp.]|nr:MAG: hypothetical protein J3Q66DRAFT_332517 [Benniella sp.]KAK3824814.1 MAG: hypothetical protein J3Q66DRAFT_326089 [Benniella sp.]